LFLSIILSYYYIHIKILISSIYYNSIIVSKNREAVSFHLISVYATILPCRVKKVGMGLNRSIIYKARTSIIVDIDRHII